MINVAINGFGRIGRNTLRNIVKRNEQINVVAINDLADSKMLAHLFKYDSVHGPFDGDVYANNGYIVIGDRKIKVLSEKRPDKLPWKELGIDVVIESTGFFTSKEKAGLHIKSGAKQVVISAPSADKEIPTIVLGVNDSGFDINSPVLSNASCTTNNVAPLVKVFDEKWGIVDG